MSTENTKNDIKAAMAILAKASASGPPPLVILNSTRKRQRKPRKPSFRTLIKQAEKAGKNVASITTRDGTTLTFGEAQPTEASNPWLVDIERATKQ